MITWGLLVRRSMFFSYDVQSLPINFHVFNYDFPLEILVAILCRFGSVRTKSGRLLIPERCDLLVQKSAFKDSRIIKNIFSILIHSKAGIDGKKLQFHTLWLDARVCVFVMRIAT